jgi:DNA anti-recombination protein RmuC
VCVFFVIATFSFSLKKQKEINLRKKTELQLQEIESELDKTKQLNSALSQSLKDKLSQIEELKSLNDSFQETLVQEQIKNKALTNEAEKLSTENKGLQEKLKPSGNKGFKR